MSIANQSFRFILVLILLLAFGFATSAPAETGNEIPANRLHRIPPGVHDPPPRTPRTPPTGLEVVNPAEFCRADAMIISWTSWHAQELLDMCLAVAVDDRVLCCVYGSSEQSQAYSQMNAYGVNMANVDFLQTADGSVWIRDYGPFCAYEDGQLVISDFYYGLGGAVDAIPIAIAQSEGLPWYRSNLVHHGGNHITDGNGMGFFSSNLTDHNSGWSFAQIEQEMEDYLGLESLVVFGRMEGDMTGHCDMFVKLLSDTLFIVGEYEHPGDAVGQDAAFLDDLAATLDGLQNLDGRDFEVRRVPMNPINAFYTYNRTYTNSLILNDKVLVPIYDTEYDAPALQVHAECMPDHEIIGINCEDLIQYLGAIHCVSNTLHDANPLIILHEPLVVADAGDTPVLSCRLNPRFTDREVEVHYLPKGGVEEEIVAVFQGGVWHAQLPVVSDDFAYWFTARAFTDALTMETTLPADAPATVFNVDVQGPSAVAFTAAEATLTARPNPCNPRTSFCFVLPDGAEVDLVVYDLAGRRQRQLLTDTWLPYGEHRIVWDGQDNGGRALPSGVYIARLTAGQTRLLQRVTLVR